LLLLRLQALQAFAALQLGVLVACWWELHWRVLQEWSPQLHHCCCCCLLLRQLPALLHMMLGWCWGLMVLAQAQVLLSRTAKAGASRKGRCSWMHGELLQLQTRGFETELPADAAAG
jgi:hypothetical protein